VSAKKILVTGAGGFIGSHLVEELVRGGASVRAFVHYNSNGSWGWLDQSPVREDIEVVAGDLRDSDSVVGAVEGMEQIYHLGALIGIPYSYVSPLAYVRTNIEGTYNILESARRSGKVQKTLVTSTSEVYGTALYTPIDEKHPLQPQSPYSATKIAADQLSLSYYNSFNTPVVIGRPFNTFGPRQSARAIIPTIITQLLSWKQDRKTPVPTVKVGNVDPMRDLTYVQDTAVGLIKICNTPQFVGTAVNIGVGSTVSVADLIQTIAKIMRLEKLDIQQTDQRKRPEKSEVMVLLSNNSHLKANTDWKQTHTLEQGLEKTIQWLEKNLEGYKPHQYNI
jgi:NAD dependent epimerase/dehydratase